MSYDLGLGSFHAETLSLFGLVAAFRFCHEIPQKVVLTLLDRQKQMLEIQFLDLLAGRNHLKPANNFLQEQLQRLCDQRRDIVTYLADLRVRLHDPFDFGRLESEACHFYHILFIILVKSRGC